MSLVEIGEMHGMSDVMPFPGLMIRCTESQCRDVSALLNRAVVLLAADDPRLRSEAPQVPIGPEGEGCGVPKVECREHGAGPACPFCSHEMVRWRDDLWQCGMTTCEASGVVVPRSEIARHSRPSPRVISEPGAAIKVTEYPLTDAERRALSGVTTEMLDAAAAELDHATAALLDEARRETIEACLAACEAEIDSYDSGTSPRYATGVRGAMARISMRLPTSPRIAALVMIAYAGSVSGGSSSR